SGTLPRLKAVLQPAIERWGAIRYLGIVGTHFGMDSMTRRSRAREVALQLLFQHDHNPTIGRAVGQRFVRDRLRCDELRSFGLSLFDGVLAHASDIDARLAEAAENCRLP